MARYRAKVKQIVKQTLINQAGGKCANPGCPNRLTEIHHIKRWAVYETHDIEHMIAICPACHDAVSRGNLRVSDEDTYRWKGIERPAAARTGSIFVEPGPAPSLLFGSFVFRGVDGITLFDFARQKVSIAVRDGELIFLNLKIADAAERPLIDVVDNYVKQRRDDISVEMRPGRWRVRGPADSNFIPSWASPLLVKADFSVDHSGIDLLDIEVDSPGYLRVAGMWMDDERGVITDEAKNRILLLSRKKGIALGLRATEARRSIIQFSGSVDASIFSLLVSQADFW
jgi:hypothetical protein